MQKAQTIDRNVLFDALVQYQEERPAIQEAGTYALARLVPVAVRDTGQSRVIGRFLLGLYDATTYPFILTDLRSLDVGLFEDCLAVLRLDNTPEKEIHEYLPKGQMIFNQLREYWG